MSLEAPIFSSSFSNGEPPTPTKTPTTCSFEDSLHTPRFESSFDDPRVTWDTADPFSSSPTTLKTRKPSYDLHTAHSDIENWFEEPREKTQAGSRGWNLGNITPRKTSNTGSFDAALTLGERTVNAVRSYVGDSVPSSTNRSAASMQTPPPTSTSKRKPHQFILPSVKPNMSNTRKTATPVSRRIAPGTPGQTNQESPQLFHGLQFSPDLFQTPLGHTMGQPGTAPAMPHHKLFWETDPNGNFDLTNSFSDPFGPTHNVALDFGLSAPQQAVADGGMGLFGLPNLDQQHGIDTALFPVPFTASPRHAASNNEDPSLFLSSPARRFGSDVAVAGSSAVRRRPGGLTPYYHQEQEAKRERASEITTKARARLGSGVSPTRNDSKKRSSPAPESRPGLKRSSTHSGIARQTHDRRQSVASFESNTSAALSRTMSRTGRTSPLKRSFQAHDVQALPKIRTSLSFKIDAAGRAVTETKLVGGRSSPIKRTAADLEIEELSTESEGQSDAEDFQITQSRNTSFNFESGIHKPGFVRDRSGSGSLSSNSIYQPSRPDSRHSFTQRVSKAPTGLGLSRISDIGSVGSDAGTIIEEEDTGDAAQMLRRTRERAQEFSRPSQPSFQSLQAFNAMRSSPPSYHGHSFGGRHPATSPTTITDPDIVTPSTDRISHRTSTTRCICQSLENGGHLMIQCESCSKWLHTKCIGLDRKNLPPVYICSFCTQTPMRGGRVREPLRTSAHIPTSPLAHKSGRYR